MGRDFGHRLGHHGYERVVSRFNTTAPPAYRAYRRLEAGSPDKNKTGWLEAWTEFRPGQPLKVEIVDEGGSEYVRNKVLRGMLISEQQLVANGKPLRAAIDANNYELADGGTTDDGLQRVMLKAARKSERRHQRRAVSRARGWLRDAHPRTAGEEPVVLGA